MRNAAQLIGSISRQIRWRAAGPESAPLPTDCFARALAELGPGGVTVADVGSRWGASDAWFRLAPLARLIGFEPDPEECRRLNALSAEHGRQEISYPVALGSEDGQATLHITREPACSSLYRPSEAVLRQFPSLRQIMTVDRTSSVPIRRLDGWASAECVDRIDFIKLDTQGSELDILRGAGALLQTCLGIEVEVEFSALYEGQPLFADVDAYLRSCGFTLWRLENQAHYAEHPSSDLKRSAVVHYEHVPVTHSAGDGRLMWANAVYFRDHHTVTDRRSLLVLGALLEAAGDNSGSRCATAKLSAHE